MFQSILLAVMSVLILSSATLAEQSIRSLRLTTDDNIAISATFYAAQTHAEFAPAVLVLHSLGRSREEWPGFAAMLQRNGISCLVIDMRGHGESTRRLTEKGPELVDYHTFTERDLTDMLLDVNASINWLTEQTNVDKHRIAIVGSGFGASLALQYAAYNSDLQALLLFSPDNYKGFPATKAMEKLGSIAMRICVSRDDLASYNTSKRLIAIHKERGYASEANTLIVCSGSLRGGDMLRGVDQLPKVIFEWLQRVLLGVTPPAPIPTTPKK